MTDPKDPKSRILARRAKFMMAIAATAGTACSSGSQVCLSIAVRDTGTDAGTDSVADTGTPEPCLGTPYEDTGANPCLSAPLDTGMAEDSQTDATDAEPVPCLKVAPDSGFDGGGD